MDTIIRTNIHLMCTSLFCRVNGLKALSPINFDDRGFWEFKSNPQLIICRINFTVSILQGQSTILQYHTSEEFGVGKYSELGE